MATKIVFFGNERIATDVNTTTPVIKTLVKAGFDLQAVVVNNEKSLSRKQRELEIETFADNQCIPILKPRKLSDIAEQLSEFNADIAVLVAYGMIIPQSIIDLFPYGIINIHPSLLPLHRGSTPIESVILNGVEKTGVSIMSLQKEMDAGPVYKQTEIVLKGNETKQELADKLLQIGSKQLADLIPSIVNRDTMPVEQNHELATYDNQIIKDDGVIDWSKPAAEIEREIRTYAGWPQSRTTLGDVEVVITQAHALPGNVDHHELGQIEHEKAPLVIKCGEKSSLCIEKIKPAGKQEMDAAGFLNGYKSRLNL